MSGQVMRATNIIDMIINRYSVLLQRSLLPSLAFIGLGELGDAAGGYAWYPDDLLCGDGQMKGALEIT